MRVAPGRVSCPPGQNWDVETGRQTAPQVLRAVQVTDPVPGAFSVLAAEWRGTMRIMKSLKLPDAEVQGPLKWMQHSMYPWRGPPGCPHELPLRDLWPEKPSILLPVCHLEVADSIALQLSNSGLWDCSCQLNDVFMLSFIAWMLTLRPTFTADTLEALLVWAFSKKTLL